MSKTKEVNNEVQPLMKVVGVGKEKYEKLNALEFDGLPIM